MSHTQYLGNHTTDAVKKSCIELLYSWSSGLQHEVKVKEAYDMLKAQGIVKVDPVHVDKVSVGCLSNGKRSSIYLYLYYGTQTLSIVTIMQRDQH